MNAVPSNLYAQLVRDREPLEASPPRIIASPIRYVDVPRAVYQHAIAVRAHEQLLGLLLVETPDPRPPAMVKDTGMEQAIAAHMEAAIALMRSGSLPGEPPVSVAIPKEAQRVKVRRFGKDSTIFIEGNYLIRGLAGAILWTLLNDHQRSGRTEFSNRELRANASLKLPDTGDNLEVRLRLLQSRLENQNHQLRIERTGRGRFRLIVLRPFDLVDS